MAAFRRTCPSGVLARHSPASPHRRAVERGMALRTVGWLTVREYRAIVTPQVRAGALKLHTVPLLSREVEGTGPKKPGNQSAWSGPGANSGSGVFRCKIREAVPLHGEAPRLETGAFAFVQRIRTADQHSPERRQTGARLPPQSPCRPVARVACSVGTNTAQLSKRGSR